MSLPLLKEVRKNVDICINPAWTHAITVFVTDDRAHIKVTSFRKAPQFNYIL